MYNANVNQQRNDGASSLCITAKKGHFVVCTLSLESNAHVNQQDNNGASALPIAAENDHVNVCTLLLQNNAHVNQQGNNGVYALCIAAKKGHVDVCTLLLKNNALVNQQTNNGNNALYSAVIGKMYDLCKPLLKHGADVNNVISKSRSILDIANATGDQNILTLMKQNQNTREVNKEVEEARKHLKALDIWQIIEIKDEILANMREKNEKVHHLKQLLLENQHEKDNIGMQVEFLIKQTNERIKQLKKFNNNNNPVKLMLDKQNTECEAAVNYMLDQITSIEKNIGEYEKEIKTFEKITNNYEQQHRECEFYKKCLEEAKYDEILKELNKECPICSEEMQPPTKIFQCSQGHFSLQKLFRES